MKLWITGGQGLVAAALKKVCEHRQIRYVATTRSEVDISSPHQINQFLQTPAAQGITHIVNCAAFTHVDQAEEHPDLAHQANALGPENIGKAANRHALHVIHLSTDYVFGLENSRPLVETDRCTPYGAYAQTKYEGENRLLAVFPRACIVRTSWVFGFGGKNFISSLLDKIKKEEKISVANDQQGRPTYAADLATALLSLLCHSGIFHYANAGATSRFEIAQTMLETFRQKKIPTICKEITPVSADHFPVLAKRPSFSVLDTKKVETLLGAPIRQWEDGLKDYLHAV